jgi:F-type H+-transporting ATPase subunit b
MNNVLSRKVQWPLLAVGFFVLCMADPAWAGDAAKQWRPVYDLVMRWINFVILAFLIVRYGGPPLVKFLRNQKNDIQKQIDQVQQEKDAMMANVQQARSALQQSALRHDEIKAKIIEMGEHKKQEIIEESKEQSRLMLESARHRIDYQIHQAHEKLRLELLDMAMAAALEKLPEEITPDDDRKLIDKYLATAVAIK